jgi:hypothetical protein
LYPNGQIHIQTIKFECKLTIQKVKPRYHPLTLTTNGSTGTIDRTIVPRPTPTQMLPPGPDNFKPCHPLSHLHYRKQAVPPNVQALLASGQAVARAIALFFTLFRRNQSGPGCRFCLWTVSLVDQTYKLGNAPSSFHFLPGLGLSSLFFLLQNNTFKLLNGKNSTLFLKNSLVWPRRH